ncbi:MAG: tetratricopeptide repeat protein [Bdellovibrionaceae bacterium]|nr:tetratricopeptide repeat protein [Bdellovibrio sp.]
MNKVISLLLFFFLSTPSFAQSEARAIPSDKAPLSNDFILYLQVERTLRRENLTKKNQLTAPTPGFSIKKEEAKRIYADALKSYDQNDFHQARKQFEEALIYLPEIDQLYFDYGKCLYRQGAYRMALSVFMMLEGMTNYSEQAQYYQGLALLRLKNYELAERKFNSLAEETNSELAPIAAFYAGQIEFKQARYADSKKHFEFVLDKSTDPQLDQSAEKYIDQIDGQEKLLLRLSKRFGYSLSVGMMYDQNVLNISQQNSTTALDAYRFSYGGSIYYHVINQESFQLSPTLAFSDLYSLNNKFKSDTTIQSTDPFIVDFYIPYNQNILIDKKNVAFIFSPGIQQIYLTKDTTAREVVFNNLIVNTGVTVAHSNYLTTAYKLYLTQEKSTQTESSTDDLQSASKYGLTVSNYYLLDKPTNANAIVDFSYLINKAEGKNVSYNKILLSLGYFRSLTPTWNLFAKADYYAQNYSESTTSRKDSDIAGYIGGSYNLSVNKLISLGLQYQTNQSNVETYKYNKLVFTTMFTLTGF